jgi:hypothetical protein
MHGRESRDGNSSMVSGYGLDILSSVVPFSFFFLIFLFPFSIFFIFPSVSFILRAAIYYRELTGKSEPTRLNDSFLILVGGGWG